MERIEKFLFIQLIMIFLLSIITVLLTNILPFSYAASLSFFTFSLIMIYFIIKTLKNKKFIISNYFKIFLLLAFILIVISSVYLKNSYSTSNMIDHHIHMLLTENIIEEGNLPPMEPCVLGEPVAMTWFYYVMGAIIKTSLNIPLEITLYSMNIYSLVFVLSFLFLIANNMFNKLIFKLSFIIFTIIIFLSHYYIPSPFTFGFIFIFGVLYALLFVKKRKILLTSLLVGISIFFHGYVFLVSLFIFFGYIIYYLLFETRKLFSKDSVRELVISGIILCIIFLIFITLRDNTARTMDIIFFEPLGGIISLTYFIQFLPFIIFAIIYIIKPIKFERKILIITNMILSILIFSSSILLSYGSDLPDRFFFFTMPLFFLLSLLFLENVKNRKITIILFIILILFICPYFFRVLFADFQYFSGGELEYYKNVDDFMIEDNIIVASSPNVYYTYFSGVKQIICDPYLQAGHLADTKVVKKRFEDLLRFYIDPSQKFITDYNISYIIFGKDEIEFLEKYDVKPFDFLESSAFEEVHSSDNLRIFDIKDLDYLPSESSVELNYTYYSRWWSLPPNK